MRIISGRARGRRLATFSGGGIRPTPDRVREAIFNLLFSRMGSLEGKTVLDLFAGTGAMGIEALSRGAASAVLVDQEPQAARIILSNLKHCGFEESALVRRGDVLSVLARLEGDKPFDLIFLDPPYGRGLVERTVVEISRLGILAPRGIVCAEAEKKDAVASSIGELVKFDHRTYGITALHVFCYPNPEQGESQ